MTGTEPRKVSEVFEEVFARYHERIRSLFYSWLNDWATAEDLAAELFTTLWRDMSQRGLELDDVEHLYGFLAHKAQWLKARHFQKLAARREQALHSALVDEDASDKSHVEARAAALAADGPELVAPPRVDMWRVLSKLPDKQRRAVVLRYYDDLDRRAVARVTGWPVRTVDFHTVNGLNTLRTAAGRPPGDSVHTTAPARHEAMRAAYQASIEAGAPLSLTELARRFGRTVMVAKHATAGIARPARTVPKDQVREHLRAALADGTYPPGSMMPPIGSIAEKFDTSNGNVTKVMQELASEGLLVKLTGPGMGAHGRYHAAPRLALVTNTYLATGHTPTGADTFPTARLSARKAA